MPIDYRSPVQRPSCFSAIRHGLRRHCPACGEGRAFVGYLQTADACDRCGAPLGHIRADDFPPYLTIVIVGHIIVPLVLLVEQHYAWPTATLLAIWLTLSIVLCLVLLPFLKGAVLGLMWSLGITGRETHSGG